MSDDNDRKKIELIINRKGADFVRNILRLSKPEKRDLTIISNSGLHPIPTDYIRGEIYEASHGNLDFTDISSVNRELDTIVINLKKVLFSETWSDIYLLPFGHSAISMTIKMTVFRLLRIETIDIFYFGNGRYDYLKRDSRNKILELDNKDPDS